MGTTATSAIQKATFKDRASFVASPLSAVRVRAASTEEKAEAGISAGTDAVAMLIRLCNGTLKVIVAERPLTGDVSEAAATFSALYGRPRREALAAATYLPLLLVDDLTDLAHRMMAARSGCPLCRCAGGYTPLVAALAQAAAQATLKTWAASGLNEHFAKIKTQAPAPVETGVPHIKAAVAAINQVVAAAGYAGSRT